jgi:hypothetical protein
MVEAAIVLGGWATVNFFRDVPYSRLGARADAAVRVGEPLPTDE